MLKSINETLKIMGEALAFANTGFKLLLMLLHFIERLKLTVFNINSHA